MSERVCMCEYGREQTKWNRENKTMFHEECFKNISLNIGKYLKNWKYSENSYFFY